MSRKSNFSKLAEFDQSERMRAAQQRPSLLQGLSPTDLAMLFPDYFKKGTPDIGGFQAAISKESAKKQGLWQQGVNDRLANQGSWLERMRKEYSGGASGSGQYYDSSAGKGGKQFQALAPRIMKDLQRDFPGLSKEDAAAIIGNLGEESGGFGQMSEAGGRGPGRGWAQWTSPDRKAKFLANVSKYGGDLSNYQANYETLRDELRGPYAGALKQMMATQGLQNKTEVFMRKYENPGIPAFDVRMRYAQRAINVYEAPTDTTPQAGQKGQTSQQAGTPTTPGAPAGDTTAQAGKRVEGTKFNVVSGYIVPQDKSLYDSRNASQCATLGKAFNPAVGRSSGWTIVDGDIKAGQVVATKQYNNPGADRVGAGYHTGVALTAPNEKGDFLLLEQYNGSGGAKTRWVNKNSYPVGHTGQTTSWGLISSGGKVHDEISQEALAYGEKLGGPNKATIGTNAGTPGQGGETAPGVEGQVDYAGVPGETGGVTVGEGEQQSASLMQPVAMMQNLMGMMGGMGGGTASPLGLITTAMGFIMPLIGSIAGERLTGEGMGGPAGIKLPHINVNRGRMGHRGHRGHSGSRSSMQSTQTTAKTATQSIPALPVDNSPISHRADIGQMSVKYESGGRGVATISSGRKDPGGVSYGEHQLASKTGTMGRYLKSAEAKEYAEKFSGLKPGSAEFNRVYKKLAEEDPKGFGKSQQDYITRTHYEPVYRHAKALGYNVNDPRVQEALYSISVQHGGAKKVVSMAKSSVGGSPEQQVESLFGARRQYVSSKGMNFDTRYKSEKREILAMDVTKYKQDEMPTRMADARPVTTTGEVGVTPTTPTTGPMMPTQVASQQKQDKGFFQKAQEFTGLGSAKSIAQPSVGATGTSATPSMGPGQTTPTYVAPGTPSVSTSVSSAAAPATPISKEARNPLGVYSTYRQSDIMHQFGYRKELSATPVTSTSNIPASPASPTIVTPTRGAMMQAPGPGPDTSAMQMKQTAAMTAAFTASPAAPSQQRIIDTPPPTNVAMNQDSVMKMIQNPVDNPSIGRAFARTAMGHELPGSSGHGHFGNGNSSA